MWKRTLDSGAIVRMQEYHTWKLLVFDLEFADVQLFSPGVADSQVPPPDIQIPAVYSADNVKIDRAFYQPE